jgi:hypothetical protein
VRGPAVVANKEIVLLQYGADLTQWNCAESVRLSRQDRSKRRRLRFLVASAHNDWLHTVMLSEASDQFRISRERPSAAGSAPADAYGD